MSLFTDNPWMVGIGAVGFIAIVVTVSCISRRLRTRKAAARRTSAPAQAPTPAQPPQRPEWEQPHPPRNPHAAPNPYPAPPHHHTHVQAAQHNAAQPFQPPYNHAARSPHTGLFPSQPAQTYFRPAPPPQAPPAGGGDDHSLRPGLSDTISLDELNSFDAQGEDKESPCPICLAPLEEEPVSAGNCLHLAHTSCLKSWLVKDTRFACPICRVPFTDTSIDDIAVALAAPG